MLVDTGSGASILDEDVLIGENRYIKNNLKVKSVTGNALDIVGQLDVNLSLGNNGFGQHRFLISKKELGNFHGILGKDWLSQNGATINLKTNGLFVHEHWIPFVNYLDIPKPGLTATIETQPEDQDDLEEYQIIGHVKISATSNTTIPTLHSGNLRVKWPKIKIPRDQEVVIYCEPSMKRANERLFGLNIGGALVDGHSKQSFVPYVNVTDHEVCVENGDVVASGAICVKKGFSGKIPGVLKEHDVIHIGHVNILDGPDADAPESIEELIRTTVNKSECPNELKQQFSETMLHYADILAKAGDKVGLCSLYQPSITLDTDDPIYVPQYPVPQAMREEMNKAIKEFLQEGIIQYSKSPYNAPTIMVRKKDSGFRTVIDYRRLNLHVITDPFPLPRIAQILEGLGGCKYFTALDLLNGFYNLEIRPSDRHKTAFSTYDGHYEFLRLPMGLKNSPSIFQRMMNVVLQGSLGKYAYIYIDDIVIYSRTAKEHLAHLVKVLTRLRLANLRIKFSKCQFFKTSIDYLGFVVGKEGLRVNPKKLISVSHFPIPKDVKGVQAFLGLIGYFRIFIKGFASIARPLYDLLKKDKEFIWKRPQNEAFNLLKDALMKAPVLAFPDFSKEFILTTDASGIALGAILTQEQEQGEVLISCASKSLKGAESRYSNTDREIAAVMFGVRNHRSYLWGNKFVIRTDHLAIPYLSRNTSDNARAMKWYLELGEYDYRVEHRPATQIKHADALSRYPYDLNKKIIAYLSPSMGCVDFEPIWDLEEWKELTNRDHGKPEVQDSDYEEKNGLIYKISKDKKELLWVPHRLRHYVIRACHDPPAMGHQGVDKTYGYMKENLYWTNMEADVRAYIKSCDICQKYKFFKHMSPTQRVPVPSEVFEEVSLDIVGPVPSSRAGNRYILAIQDRLSRWLMFCPISDQSAETVVRTFLTKWICVYGVPLKIVTDRGTNFLSELFKELRVFLGIRPGKTCAYRPEGNGMNERTHRGLHQYLAMYLEPSNRMTWDTMLQVAAWVHNSSTHDSLKVSPFEIVTGLKPRSAQAWIPGSSEDAITTTERFRNYYGVSKEHLEEIRQRARKMIGKAQDDYLERLNRYSKEMTYKVGDLVLTRIQDRSTFVSRKWHAKYKGPYKVTAIIGPAVVKIKNLETGIEDLIHVVYLRPYNERKSPPPQDDEDYETESESGNELELPEPASQQTQQTKADPNEQNLEELIESPTKDDDDDKSESEYKSSDEASDEEKDDNFQTPDTTFNWDDLSPGISPSHPSILKDIKEPDSSSTSTPTLGDRLKGYYQKIKGSPEKPDTTQKDTLSPGTQTPDTSTPGLGQRLLQRLSPRRRRQLSQPEDSDSSQEGGDGGDLSESGGLRRSKRIATKPQPVYKETRIETKREISTRKKKDK